MYAKLLTLAGCFVLSLLCLSSSEVQAEENPLLNARQKSIGRHCRVHGQRRSCQIENGLLRGLATA